MKPLIFLLLSVLTVYGQDHFSKSYHLNNLSVVVEEGGKEDPGQGSYSIRVYKWLDHSSWPGTYYSGLIRPRDGTVEQVILWEGKVVVVVRSIGTGGYLDVDVFEVKGKKLRLLGSVTDLKPDQSVVAALKKGGGKR